MSKHTPGPWNRVANSIQSRKAGCVIVRLPALTDRVGDETPKQIERWDADARLIAAAPELLEALKWYAEQLEDLNRNSWTAEKALGVLRADRGKKALAVIAKAKGE